VDLQAIEIVHEVRIGRKKEEGDDFSKNTTETDGGDIVNAGLTEGLIGLTEEAET
jgi:hypothetical protein